MDPQILQKEASLLRLNGWNENDIMDHIALVEAQLALPRTKRPTPRGVDLGRGGRHELAKHHHQ